MMTSELLAPNSTPEIPESVPTSSIQRIKTKARNFYKKYEKYSELVIFFAGFLWDALTLQRIDSWLDNLFLLGYLILIGGLIILTLRRQNGAVFPKWLGKWEPRFPWVLQFCFGGLFSSYVVFYFKSASFTRTLFFFLLLVGLLIANEFIEDRLQNRKLLAVLYSFCCFSFLAFFLPVVLAIIKPWVFVLAGILSVAASLFVFAMGLRTKGVDWKISIRPVIPWVLGVFVLLNFLYFASLIPPVPLALKVGHPYHSVKKTSKGFEVKYVPPSWFYFWRKWDNPFYWTPGESVYCLTAVFAPTKVHVPLIHVWHYKTKDGWKVTDRMRFGITGGRDGGYRLYSKKSGVKPGNWRVEVQTENGLILGEIDFTVKKGAEPAPPLKTGLIK
jgi:hypothetical protein